MVEMFCWELIWKEGPEVWEQEVTRAFRQEEILMFPLVGMLKSMLMFVSWGLALCCHSFLSEPWPGRSLFLLPSLDILFPFPSPFLRVLMQQKLVLAPFHPPC